jgi:hypothetical protein
MRIAKERYDFIVSMLRSDKINRFYGAEGVFAMNWRNELVILNQQMRWIPVETGDTHPVDIY